MPGPWTIGMPWKNTLFFDKARMRNYMLNVVHLAQQRAFMRLINAAQRSMIGATKFSICFLLLSSC